jgi:chromosome segregation ATPase
LLVCSGAGGALAKGHSRTIGDGLKTHSVFRPGLSPSQTAADDVCYRRKSGKYLLLASISQFDPLRKLIPQRSNNTLICADLKQTKRRIIMISAIVGYVTLSAAQIERVFLPKPRNATGG